MDPEQADRLLARIEGRVARGFKSMVRDMKSANTVDEIEARLAAGDYDHLLAGLDEAANKLAIDVNTGYVQAGQRMSRIIDAEVDEHHAFDVANDRAVAWMTDQADTMVEAMRNEQLQVARQIASDGASRGWSNREIAEEIRDSIGLNGQQADYVSSYRDALEGGDFSNAIARELADDRYDGALTRARESGRALADDRIDAMVGKYRDNWVDARGDFIGNMEGQSAMNAGIDESLTQAVDVGDLLANMVQRTWYTRDDSKVRRSHVSMHGQTVGFGEDFITGYGAALRYPGDEDAPADETANCRCVQEVSIDVTGMFGKMFRRVA